jgi:NifU-like protein involved in Fe-S cluster formation
MDDEYVGDVAADHEWHHEMLQNRRRKLAKTNFAIQIGGNLSPDASFCRLDREAQQEYESGMLSELYNKKILAAAAAIPFLERLEAPDASARAHSKLCGSTVEVDVRLDDGRVSAFGQTVKACALGQASASLLGQHVIGRDLDELRAGQDALRAMLKEGAPPPGGLWADLEILEPVRDFKARHASTMLAFEATVDAVEKALASSGDTAGEQAQQSSAPEAAV